MNENEFENGYSPVPVQAEPPVPTAARVLGYVTLGLGISSLCTLFAGLPFAVAGLITGGISRSKNYGHLTKQARIGRILSIIGIPVSVLWFIGYVVLLVFIMEGSATPLPINGTKDFYFFLRTLF